MSVINVKWRLPSPTGDVWKTTTHKLDLFTAGASREEILGKITEDAARYGVDTSKGWIGHDLEDVIEHVWAIKNTERRVIDAALARDRKRERDEAQAKRKANGAGRAR